MDEKTYLVTKIDGSEFQITVPETWKVTFGPATKGNTSYSGEQRLKMPMALRFYESETKQRAIFTDVVSFRDMSIKIKIKKNRVQEKDGYMECDGVRKRTIFQATVSEWIDPDEVKPELPMLPSDKEMFAVAQDDEM
jgi:hypothetical protein